MTDSETDQATLSADDAFGALGNATRMQILQSLGDADGPLTFSQLREAVGMRDSGQFNYHLDKLLGRFVEQGEEGYRLRQTGRRVNEAILSGVVTKAPRSELTVIDEKCHYCGSPIAVLYAEERIHMYCTNCEGTYSGTHSTVTSEVPDEYGRLGTMLLPPAGVEGRSPAATYRAAWTWANFEILAAASGVCPRCSADVEHSADLCSEHDLTGELCANCGRRHALFVLCNCQNCNYEIGGGAFLSFGTLTPLLSFLFEHGLNPISPAPKDIHRMNRVHEDYTEEVRDTDPPTVRLTIDVDGDEFGLTVDEDLTITEVDR